MKVGEVTCSCGETVVLDQKDSCFTPSGRCPKCGHLFMMNYYLSGDQDIYESVPVSDYVFEHLRITKCTSR